jgi:exosortase/archaeosortase family protein
MLVVFVALSAAMALLTKRPLMDKVILLISSIPIAVVSNILRITATGILYETTSSETANAFFHDLGGWLMMPLGLLLLAIELKLLSYLFLDAPPAPPPAVRNPALRRLRKQPPAPTRQARPAPRKPIQPPAVTQGERRRPQTKPAG